MGKTYYQLLLHVMGCQIKLKISQIHSIIAITPYAQRSLLAFCMGSFQVST